MERSHQERDLKHSVPDTPCCRNYLLLSGKQGGLIVSNNNLSELMKGMIEYTQDIVSDVTRSIFIRKFRTEALSSNSWTLPNCISYLGKRQKQ